ncbi:hypothetical protein [Variovorax soli]|jgi:hypothetical protein|uniref:hypothetical protein n=1 Tax=Variovorax soli TaxID=376815 RepID=UPI0008388B81|nr:hypothetical protein [Variovorax soli]
MSKSDPIRERYFDALARADSWADCLFYLGGALSLAALLMDKAAHPVIYNWLQILFAVSVFGLFAVGLATRLYLAPRAEDKRRQDFVGNAYGVGLSGLDRTEGYYNNGQPPGTRRMAAQILENSHFSKAIALRMVGLERAKIVVYTALWLICLMHRETDLGIVVAVSQAVFSEQIVSRWLRLEWLRMRFEKTYDDVCRIFHATPPDQAFDAMTLESLGVYEAAKANSGITLSSRLFHRMNDQLSREWEQARAQINI